MAAATLQERLQPRPPPKPKTHPRPTPDARRPMAQAPPPAFRHWYPCRAARTVAMAMPRCPPA
ncbi:hypothetical protein NZ30_01150 [Xanthomonas translucens pv. undulosa]|nr:hypothetical protein NZ30_01150 [Xanthomonas translucens pv. undulosa]